MMANKRANRVILSIGLGLVVAGMTGCEWEGSGDGDFWSEQHEHLDFSGIYRPAQGNSIVVSYDIVEDSSGMANRENEVVGQGDGDRTTFGGVLEFPPVVPGSLSISAGAYDFVDNGDGTLSGADEVFGTIVYGTGAWSINTRGVPVGAGVPVLATYRYLTGGGGRPSDLPSGVQPISQIVVQQTGNQVRLQDNHGNVYQGSLAAVDTTSATQESETRHQIDQRFSFTAEGEAFGRNATIVGSFRAFQTIYFSRELDSEGDQVVRSQLTELYRIASYFLQGSWSDDAGNRARMEATGPANQRIQVLDQ